MDSNAPTILIVDDADINIMILDEILCENYRIITANNGKEGLERLRSAEPLPKIVLLDVMMPEMNGREMFEMMKADAKFRRIPVIFITAENDSESELLAAGAVDFINKPFLPEIVKLRVRNQIDLKNYSDNLEKMVEEKTAEATLILDSALQGLANVIEYRNLESGEHVKRTQLYVNALCHYLIESDSEYAKDLIELQPEIITKSMALHDIGKISIPDRILLKPGRLDPDEYETMKTHTTRGAQIIGELGDISSSLYLKHCEDICLYHHERWDGRGYPCNLKGAEIPLVARLAAVSDVYDALVSTRVYKPALPCSEAIKMIAEGTGYEFDPIIVDAMVAIQDRFLEIARKYQ
ncbi:MAG: response regulator [Treponema sp.]|nr:response regulator [Treponema sp.]